MRDYLFRGKRVDNGEWVEGYLGYNKVRKQYYTMNDVDSFPIPVHKESVGQYTGMHDNSGRKIFDGDIISIKFETDGIDGFPGYHWYESARVAFSEEKYAWIVIFDDGGEEMYLNEYDDVDDICVIGTAFDDSCVLESDVIEI